MSSSPQRSRAGNGSAAVPGRELEDVQQGSVRAARERLRAIQAVRAQASKSERSPRSDDVLVQKASPTSPRRPWEASSYSPTSRQRTYEQDYDYQEPALDPSWPLPASRYNPTSREAKTPPSRRKEQNQNFQTEPSSGTFYDAATQQLSPRMLQPPQQTFGKNSRDGYSPSEPYSPASATSPAALGRTLSTASSASGGIPDFPLPTSQYQTGRRSQNVAASNRARRGPSSYYSQLSGPFGVSPIPEESNSRSTNSYASSNVIPSQMKDFFLDPTPSDDEDVSTVEFDWSRDGERIQPKSPGLVRQASLGRRQKPALTTIKGGENLRPPVATAALPTEVYGSKATRTSHVASILDGESVLLDASSSEPSRRPKSDSFDLTDPFNPGDAIDQRTGAAGSSRNEGKALAERRENKLGGSTERGATRRPPKIDVQAIREAEARASLTSLPDLIRRATRLAANLERGKTASRLGMDWMLNPDEKQQRGYRPSVGSSLSGMLASFPPPATMPGGQTPSDGDTAEELYKNLNIKRTRDGIKDRRNRRKICGLSRRAFVAVLLIIFFLVAAAVILPVFLIVLPNKNKTTTSATVPVSTALQNCQQKNPCSNGGTVVVNLDQSCGCICTNGFTGSQCNTQSNAGCTTISASGTNSATVGTQIPGLISTAQQKFSIPLDASALSSAFAANNMTCTTENAIVTFQDVTSTKRGLLNADAKRGIVVIKDKVAIRRRNLEYATSSTIASGGSATIAPTAVTVLTSATATTTSSAEATSTFTSGMGANSSTMQFAKVGILFVLQDSRDLGVAVSAQENLSQFLAAVAKGSSSMAMNNITLGSGYFIDLTDFVVTLRNRTQYGIGVNFNGTATGSRKEKRRSFSEFFTRLFY